MREIAFSGESHRNKYEDNFLNLTYTDEYWAVIYVFILHGLSFHFISYVLSFLKHEMQFANFHAPVSDRKATVQFDICRLPTRGSFSYRIIVLACHFHANIIFTKLFLKKKITFRINIDSIFVFLFEAVDSMSVQTIGLRIQRLRNSVKKCSKFEFIILHPPPHTLY